MTCRYLGYGPHSGEGRGRNAPKMASGWPTFPMVSVKDVLVGGASDLGKLVASVELHRTLREGA